MVNPAVRERLAHERSSEDQLVIYVARSLDSRHTQLGYLLMLPATFFALAKSLPGFIMPQTFKR